jgi:ABC-type oligopeptide transport system substrate-binding subunit/DNA-binding SARP family transcriptional activator
MSALELFLLGGLELRSLGEALAKPPTVKSQSLLAYLALHRERPHTREHLAEVYWGDRPERKARRSLTTALWHIRRYLPEPGYLLAESQTVQLDDRADIWLDVDEFEALASSDDLADLQSAAELYRDELLAGFYDDWIITLRYRLETLFGQVLTELMIGQEAAGEHEAALTTALRLLAHDPLREDAHRLAMVSFCRLGQRHAALEQYRRCHEIVQREIGAEPLVETTELYQAILEGLVEIGQAATVMPAARAESLAPARSGADPLDAAQPTPLVGREPEIAFLRACQQKAQQGRGGLVLVSGEAGIGKTRLANEFASQFRWQGACVLWGRCYEFERVVPYQPIVEALRSVMPTVTRAELGGNPDWVLVEVAKVVPEIAERLPELKIEPAIRSSSERLRLFEALVRFVIHQATGGPLLLVLDDLHWATESTLQMVHYLVRHTAAHGILTLGTLRPEAVGRQHPITSLQKELGREGLLMLLGLEALAPEAVEALVGQMSGDANATLPLARRLYTETEGNPFFLMEMIKALFEAGWLYLEGGVWRGDFSRISREALPLPAGVGETIRARIQRLSDDPQQALYLAAVLGREFDFELLDALWGRNMEVTLAALDSLLRRRLIEEGTGALARDYTFSHHKIQEVVYAHIPRRRRQHLHAQAGAAMERVYGSHLDEVAGELAFHFREGACADKAIAYLLRAGDRARLAQAGPEAVDYYQQALELLTQKRQYELAARTLMKLGLTHHSRLDFEAAREAYDEGFVLWQRAAQSRPSGPLAPVQTLRSWQIEPATLEPARVTDWHSGVVLEQLFACLVRFGPALEVLPEAAIRWEVLDGGCRYVFHLRQDGRWSDGVPVTAQDFEYAWKRLLAPGCGPGPAASFYNVKGARAYHQGQAPDPDSVAVRSLDDYTLAVELEQPDHNFLHLSLYAIPVPRHQVEVHGEAWTEAGLMVSNGPFRLETWRHGESMTLVRNAHYAGRFEGTLERVALSFAPAAAALAAYEAGQMDILALDLLQPAEMERARQQHPGEYLSVPELTTYYMRFDVVRPPFHDRRVRRAFALATDRRRLADVVMGGHESPATGGHVPPAAAGHSAGIALPFRPPEARALLAEAGYSGGCGFPVTELIVGQGREAVVQDLVAQWQANLGVQVVGETMAWASFLARVHREPPHILAMGSAAHYPDPATFVGTARRDEEHAAYVWHHSAYDCLAQEAAQATDPDRRLALYQQMDRIIVEEAWIVPLWYGRRHLLVQPWVVRLPTSPGQGCFWKDTIVKPH